MKYSLKDIAQAWKFIESYRHDSIKATITHVSRSGMSRRMRFLAAHIDPTSKHAELTDITWAIARICDYSMSDQGLRADGCGMDMRFSVISNFNYAAAGHDLAAIDPTLSWDSPEGYKALDLPEGSRIYDDYFFDADRL